MSTTDLVALDALLARLDKLERLAGVPGPEQQGVDAEGYPTYVVSGELIESAWGNAVVDAAIEARPMWKHSTVGGMQVAASNWTNSQTVTLTNAVPGTYLVMCPCVFRLVAGNTSVYGNLTVSGITSTGDNPVSTMPVAGTNVRVTWTGMTIVSIPTKQNLSAYVRFGFGSQTIYMEPHSGILITRLGDAP